MKAYVIVLNGRYFRKVQSRSDWSDTLAGARLYVSEKELDKDLLDVVRGYCWAFEGFRRTLNGVTWPHVEEVDIQSVKVIKHDERFIKNFERAQKAEATRVANWEKHRQKEAQREVEQLEERLRHAKERAGL